MFRNISNLGRAELLKSIKKTRVRIKEIEKVESKKWARNWKMKCNQCWKKKKKKK